MKSIYTIARVTVSGIWFYHGFVPKLLFKHPDEFAPILDSGFTPAQAAHLVTAAGILEISMAFILLIFWRSRIPFWVTIGLMVLALVSVSFTTPRLLYAAFNPVSLNLSMIALSVIGLRASSSPK